MDDREEIMMEELAFEMEEDREAEMDAIESRRRGDW